MSKHTGGQWAVNKDDWGSTIIVSSARQAPITKMHNWVGISPSIEPNAARIVACVNACEGIEDPSVVPELLEVLKGYADQLWKMEERAGIGPTDVWLALSKTHRPSQGDKMSGSFLLPPIDEFSEAVLISSRR